MCSFTVYIELCTFCTVKADLHFGFSDQNNIETAMTVIIILLGIKELEGSTRYLILHACVGTDQRFTEHKKRLKYARMNVC